MYEVASSEGKVFAVFGSNETTFPNDTGSNYPVCLLRSLAILYNWLNKITVGGEILIHD